MSDSVVIVVIVVIVCIHNHMLSLLTTYTSVCLLFYQEENKLSRINRKVTTLNYMLRVFRKTKVTFQSSCCILSNQANFALSSSNSSKNVPKSVQSAIFYMQTCCKEGFKP